MLRLKWTFNEPSRSKRQIFTFDSGIRYLDYPPNFLYRTLYEDCIVDYIPSTSHVYRVKINKKIEGLTLYCISHFYLFNLSGVIDFETIDFRTWIFQNIPLFAEGLRFYKWLLNGWIIMGKFVGRENFSSSIKICRQYYKDLLRDDLSFHIYRPSLELTFNSNV